MSKYEPDFMLIKVGEREMGVLRTVGNREFVGTVKFLMEADSADNEWLAEQLLQICQQYYSRVREYRRGGESEK